MAKKLTASVLSVYDEDGNKTEIPAVRGKDGVDGCTPKKGEDYFTEADKAEIVAMVIESLGGNPVFGYVDENSNIIVQGSLADGTYIVKYEMEDGSTVEIGQLVLDNNVYYSVTNTLTNCTNSNSATQAAGGEGYSAVITADSGYELSSVSVTMGGSAVNVTDGAISIASVTGDIVITAVAEEAQASYTNLAEVSKTNTTDWSIWCNDARIGSDGGYRANAGSTNVSNYIPVKNGDTVYWSGMDIRNSDDETVTTASCFYDSNKAKVGSFGDMSDFITNGYISNVSISGSSGQFTITLDGVSYLRLGMLQGSGTDLDNVIITVNEPIV